jgi:uncharacterized glyoxalase superfamily protein PhnB
MAPAYYTAGPRLKYSTHPAFQSIFQKKALLIAILAQFSSPPPSIFVLKQMKRHPQTPLADQPFSMASIAPNIYVKDLKQTIDFYKMLGFEIITSVPEKGDAIFTMMRCGGVTLMFQTFASIENSLPVVSRNDGGSLLLYIKVKKIRALFETLKDKVEVLHGLEKTFYGATEFSIKDVNNYMLTFAENE